MAMKRPAASPGATAAAAKAKAPAAKAQKTDTSPKLRHRYFALRHGESEANVAGIITSDPVTGCQRWGLTAKGREVTAASAESFAASALGLAAKGAEKASKLPSVRIVASDFKRTKETSELFAATLAKILKERAAPGSLCEGDGEAGIGKGLCPRPTPSLRERQFGELEEGPNTRYGEVWAEDLKDATSTAFGAESAKAVQDRTAALIKRLEQVDLATDAASGPAIVVLVSHGDALQLLQTAFVGKPPAEHRSLQHLDPAELRELVPTKEGLALLSAAAA